MTVARDIDRRTSRELLSQFERSPIAGAYGYEDFCLETFRACNSLGVKRYYDLPIAYWRVANRLMEEEAQRCPAWKQTLTFELEAEHYARKDEELNLADEVFVASDFVKRSLEGSPVGNKPIHVVPFGSPIPMGGPREDNRGNKKLRVLFVGSMGQRKGLADLFAAIRLLARSDIELHVLGSRLAPADFYEQECSSFIYHAPRARSQVLELMRSCDVFVLPSIVEGRALVQQEALSCGLPIVVTANAGGEDLVDEGRTGFLVPIRSPESIADRLAWLADKPDEIPAMRQAAMEKAGQYSWAAYGRHIVAILSGENVGQNVEPSYAVMEGV
jgi:glycosyltransferase involved in cell wall biosynthesis